MFSYCDVGVLYVEVVDVLAVYPTHNLKAFLAALDTLGGDIAAMGEVITDLLC